MTRLVVIAMYQRLRITQVYLLCLHGLCTIGNVCEGEGGTLQLECSDDKTVFIVEVLYGRLNVDTCPHPAITISDWNCRAENALMIVRNHCIGHSLCEVQASNGMFGDPCPGTHKYLYIKYACEGWSII